MATGGGPPPGLFSLPRTTPGRVAVGLIVYFAIAFLVGPALESIRGLALLVVSTALLSGLVAGILAIIAIRRDGERSLLVYLALGPAIFVLMFLIGELVFPH